MRVQLFWLSLAGLGLAGCVREDAVGPVSETLVAQATIRDVSGRTVGSASVGDAGGLRVRVRAAGLAPGTYGVHVHAVGRCEPPSFASAGPHWNPTVRQHGSLNPLGLHLGDLPNLSVGADGIGAIEFSIAGASLRGDERMLMDGDGAALVIHASPDDYRTDPSGNSGARIACGVLG